MCLLAAGLFLPCSAGSDPLYTGITLIEKIKSLLAPKEIKNSIFDISEEYLKEKKMKGLLVDCDSTLMPWKARTPDDSAKAWVNRMKDAGFKLCIVSNNMFRHERITGIATAFGLPCISEACKPFPFGLRRALAVTQTSSSETMMIGDQLLTDIVGGNYLGIHTVLVTPLGGGEFPTTAYINRNIEKLIIGYLKKTGAWNFAGSDTIQRV